MSRRAEQKQKVNRSLERTAGKAAASARSVESILVIFISHTLFDCLFLKLRARRTRSQSGSPPYGRQQTAVSLPPIERPRTQGSRPGPANPPHFSVAGRALRQPERADPERRNQTRISMNGPVHWGGSDNNNYIFYFLHTN